MSQLEGALDCVFAKGVDMVNVKCYIFYFTVHAPIFEILLTLWDEQLLGVENVMEAITGVEISGAVMGATPVACEWKCEWKLFANAGECW